MATSMDSPISAHLAGARRDTTPNVTGGERWASMLGGGALAALGVRRGGVSGAAMSIVGAALVARGVARRDPVKRLVSANALELRVAHARGWSTAGIAARTVTINAPSAEVYALWRDLRNLPRWMENIERIEIEDDRRSRWTVRAPLGQTVEWVSNITADEPGKRIAWESDPDADVRSAGWVEFQDWPNGRGCVVRAMIAYEPPGGQVGRLAAKTLRTAPEIQVRTDLRRLKQMVETGEIATAQRRRSEERTV